MTLSNDERQDIIKYVNDSMEGDSTCDDEDKNMVVFTFDPQMDSPSIGTDTTLELLKRGFFILYALLNEERKFELAITNGEGYRE